MGAICHLPDLSTFTRQRPADAMLVTAVPVYHVTSITLGPAAGSVSCVTDKPRKVGLVLFSARCGGCAVAHLAILLVTVPRASATDTIPAAKVAPFACIDTHSMILAALNVSGVDLVARTVAFVADAGSAVLAGE